MTIYCCSNRLFTVILVSTIIMTACAAPAAQAPEGGQAAAPANACEEFASETPSPRNNMLILPPPQFTQYQFLEISEFLQYLRTNSQQRCQPENPNLTPLRTLSWTDTTWNGQSGREFEDIYPDRISRYEREALLVYNPESDQEEIYRIVVSGPTRDDAAEVVEQYIADAQVCLEPILFERPPQLALGENSLDLPTILHDAGGSVNNINDAAMKAADVIAVAVPSFQWTDLTNAFEADTLSPDHAVCALQAAYSGDKDPLADLLKILLTPIAEGAMLDEDEALPSADDLLIISMQLLSMPWTNDDLEQTDIFAGVFYYVDPPIYGRGFQSYVTKYSKYASVTVCASINSVRDRFWYYRTHLAQFDVAQNGTRCDWREHSSWWSAPYDTQVQGLTSGENKYEIYGSWYAGEWDGYYYSNRSFTGTPKWRVDGTINFNWGTGSPRSDPPNDNFSVRWKSGNFYEKGTYLFEIYVDDGVRLYVDDLKNPVIDAWKDQSATYYKANVPLEKGYHNVVVEYYEHEGDARIAVRYRKQ